MLHAPQHSLNNKNIFKLAFVGCSQTLFDTNQPMDKINILSTIAVIYEPVTRFVSPLKVKIF